MSDVWEEMAEGTDEAEGQDVSEEQEGSQEAGSEQEGSEDPKANAQRAMDTDERQKRQALEDQLRRQQVELAELRGMVRGGQKGTAEEKYELPPLDYSRDDLGLPAREKALKKALIEEISGGRQKRFNDRLASSETLSRLEYDDFEDVIPTFTQAAQANPALYQTWRNHSDPARFAYVWAKKNGTPQNVSALQKRIAELEAQVKGQPAPKKRTSNAAGSGRGAKPGGGSASDDDDILDEALDGR